MDFLGANPGVQAIGLEPLQTQTHYMIGAAEQWHTGLPSFSRVEYRDIYPGIDIVYYGDQSGLKYKLIFHPGADPSQVMLRFEDTEPIHVETNGDIVLHAFGGEWRHSNVKSYELRSGVRSRVPVQFVASGPNEVTIAARRRRSLETMVIIYGTYLGGSGQDSATSITVDAAGNTYVAGWTESTDLPETAGTRLGRPNGVDAYVAKLSPSGTVLYITYLGGSGEDRAFGICVDGSGSAVVVGTTYSMNFPTLNAVQASLAGGHNAFVAKLNAAGNGLVFSTFLGGNGADSANAVALDAQANIYVAGETTSSNFPILNPLQFGSGGGDDAFVSKFSSIGARLYSTYLGGAGNDRATAIAVDASGDAYITGSTYSTNFPTQDAFQAKLGGGQDAFAAKVGASGNSLIYSTYLGGSGGTVSAPETGNGIAVDSTGSAYIAGATSSSNFPTLSPLQPVLNGSEDAFVLKLSAAGSSLVYSTYLGGSSFDVATAIAIDSADNAYVVGYTASTDFPVANAIQGSNAGSYDAFIVELSSAGNNLVLGTYLGGSGSDSGNSIALDGSGNIYVGGQTLSTAFPTSAAVQLYPSASAATFVANIGGARVNPQTISPASGTRLSTSTVTFSWNSVTGAQDYWIDVGTAPRQGNIVSGYTGGATSKTVNLTPYLTGATIYIQLYSQFSAVTLVAGTGSLFEFATASTGVNPQLISPALGTILSTSSVTFTWNAVTGAQDYWVDVGTSPRSGNIQGGFTSGAPSITVNLTGYLTGGTIYIQLYSKFPGINPVPGTGSLFQFATTAPIVANPQLISPVSGTVLSTSSVTFTWSAVTGAQDYWVDVGTSPRSGNIQGGFTSGAPSVTVNLTGYLTGGTIYIQLYSKFPGINPVPGTGSLFQFITAP